MKIYVITHKKANIIKDKIYEPLHVGAEGKTDLGYLKDNTGDNISLKNKNYCELTGLYWIWKNVKTNITGIVHYRRYFYKNMFSLKESNVLNEEDIKKILKDYDCIVAKKSKIPFGSVEKYYAKHHYQRDYDITRDAIKELYPDYVESFEKVSKSNYYYNLNMMICNKKLMNKYCKWLFDILSVVEEKSDITNYSDYDKRIYGFLSEILLRVWLNKNNIKVKECNVYNNELGLPIQFIKRLIMNCIIPR